MNTRLQHDSNALARARMALDLLALGIRTRALDHQARGNLSTVARLDREAKSLEAIARLPNLTPAAALQLDELATHYAWRATERTASATTLPDLADAVQIAKAAKALRNLASLLPPSTPAVTPAPLCVCSVPLPRRAEGNAVQCGSCGQTLDGWTYLGPDGDGCAMFGQSEGMDWREDDDRFPAEG